VNSSFQFRPATREDRPALERVIAASARQLSRGDYTDEQIEAALGSAFGVDTQLIDDGTYFAAVVGDEIVACGGWSFRGTLFGADAHAGRSDTVLDPAKDAARIRAFFIHPDWARRGLGRALLEQCEKAACARGFTRAQLMATLPGHRLYLACGYVGEERRAYPLRDGITIDFIPMTKDLRRERSRSS
jgi:GNAT superfamily N-acetyltransferase